MELRIITTTKTAVMIFFFLRMGGGLRGRPAGEVRLYDLFATRATVANIAINEAIRIGEKSGPVTIVFPPPIFVTDITAELLDGNVTLLILTCSVLMKVKVGPLKTTNQSTMTKPRIIIIPKTAIEIFLAVFGLMG